MFALRNGREPPELFRLAALIGELRSWLPETIKLITGEHQDEHTQYDYT